MNKLQIVINSIKRVRLLKIITSSLLTLVLFFATFSSSDSALAASNKSSTTYPTDDSDMKGLLYSDSDDVDSLDAVDDFISPERQKQLLDPTQIPAKKQPRLDRSDPDAKLLEKVGEMFDEAGDFSAN